MEGEGGVSTSDLIRSASEESVKIKSIETSLDDLIEGRRDFLAVRLEKSGALSWLDNEKELKGDEGKQEEREGV